MGCRCYMCRVANADYERERLHRNPYSRNTAMVGAESVRKARKRVLGWMDEGYPLREICRTTGVSRGAMRTLVSGKHPNAAMRGDHPRKSRRMKRENYEAIMRCDMGRRKISGGTYVDAKPVNDALAWLDAHGVKRAQVAREAGIPSATIYQIGKRNNCRFETMRKIAPVALRMKEEIDGRTA